jgi:lipopolysaccharide transport system ATP-binding protein
MSKEYVIEVVGLSKRYTLGLLGANTLSADLKRFWHTIRGKEDPTLSIAETNSLKKQGGKYVWALKDVNFKVNRGEVLGVIGKNGAGKSTLLKLLSKVTSPSQGEIRFAGKIASLLEVGTGFHPELTGRENIFQNGAILGMTKYEITNKIEDIIEFSGIGKYIDTPVKRYSSGMYVRLAFAVAAHLDSDILIVDEVLAVGDAEFQNQCMGKMKEEAESGRTVLFVSHNMESINNLCDRCILMDSGTVISEGLPSDIVTDYLSLNNEVAESINDFSGEEQPGDDIVKLLKARLIDDKGDNIIMVKTCEKLGVELELNYLMDKKPLPVINFYTIQGEMLFTAPFNIDPEDIKDGINKIVFWIPADLLNKSKYVIGIELMSFKPVIKQHIDIINLLSIDVQDDAVSRTRILHESLYSRGIIRPHFNWEINK